MTYFGDHCFRVQSGELSLLVNPASNRLKGDIVLRTLTATTVLGQLAQEIIFPGEYEMSGIVVKGIPVAGESTEKFLKTIYTVLWEEMRLVFFGHLSKPIDATIIEEIGEPDIVFIPTGDDHFILPEAAVKLVKQLEPALVVPSYMKHANEFVKAFGQKAEPQEKYVFKKKDLMGKKSEIVLLQIT